MEFHRRLAGDVIAECRTFAEESAKTQRESRSGGTQFRSLHVIAEDTFRGKLGEAVVKDFLEQEPFQVPDIKLDFNIYPRGRWDKNDFDIGGVRFSIKSVKHFSSWLLLESKDIDNNDVYDVYILVAIARSEDGGSILGFALKDEIMKGNDHTLLLEKGKVIPGTKTILDADNHARHKRHLHNSQMEWTSLICNILEEDDGRL